MTERKGAVTRAEFEAMRAEIAALVETVDAQARQAADAQALRHEDSQKIDRLYQALMVPQPGNEKALVDRVAAVAIAFEVGDQATRWIVRGAQVLAALGVIVGTIWAIRHGGGGPTR
ncbi:hypothetical protein [Paragemmobacter ruber]|uniref:DUF3618 domain-containing protein n=1 Tax=Paragemmobacter ruber TaxID=1985673 RepID=A0ABW9Y091_9RHOB|nr:hypothetical protein [Rhodobacter ruber]NBE05920.1 hypothetical protein [Rhodobacter ruber]